MIKIQNKCGPTTSVNGRLGHLYLRNYGLPFVFAQGGESFDLAQDREPVERLVEPFRVSSFVFRASPSPLRWVNRMTSRTILYCHFRMHNLWDGVLGCQNNFAELPTRFHHLIGLSSFAQRHDAMDNRFESAGPQ